MAEFRWDHGDVTPDAFNNALKNMRLEYAPAFDVFVELEAQMEAETSQGKPFRLSKEQCQYAANNFIVTATAETEGLYGDDLDDIIEMLTRLKRNLDTDIDIVYYKTTFDNGWGTDDRAEVEIISYKLATRYLMDDRIHKHCIAKLKEQLSKALCPEGRHYPKNIECQFLKLWLDGSVDNKTLQTLIYGTCEV